MEGFDINKNYVEYANSRAKILNLSHLVRYFCKDIRELRVDRRYDVVAFLGLGMTHIYGKNSDALEIFKTMLHKEGFLILAEPVWLSKPVSSEVLKNLDVVESSFLTEAEMQKLMEEAGFHVLKHFVSSKEDWELYVRPVYVAMQEIVESNSDLVGETRKIINGFKNEYDAVGKHWDMLLWVAKLLA